MANGHLLQIVSVDLVRGYHIGLNRDIAEGKQGCEYWCQLSRRKLRPCEERYLIHELKLQKPPKRCVGAL